MPLLGYRRLCCSCLHCMIIVLCIMTNSHCGRNGAPRWWNAVQLLPQNIPSSKSTTSAPKPSIPCSKIPGLVPKQLRFCRDNPELVDSIIKGAKLGINECKYQLKERRWNCSTSTLRSERSFNRRSIFGHVLDSGSRESAFVHALTTAGVAYAVTKACSSGSMFFASCGCDPVTKELSTSLKESFQDHNWRWGGCNDHIDYGIGVSRSFVDPHLKVMKARAQMKKHNNEAGREVETIFTAIQFKKRLTLRYARKKSMIDTTSFVEKLNKCIEPVTIGVHEAARIVLKNGMWPKCKCHGLSGSCELKTCWWSMPSFRKVGKILKQRYDEASEMTVEKHKMATGKVDIIVAKFPTFSYPAGKDLVYLDKSPDYCESHRRKGIRGTHGRQCNATSQGPEGCDHLCCGRGYKTTTVFRKERCNCSFHWCCHVSCDECMKEYQVHTCL